MTGWQHADGVDYLYQDGKKLTGLQKHDNKVYYLINEGVKQVGWLNLGSWYYMSEDGAMITGWFQAGGK